MGGCDCPHAIPGEMAAGAGKREEHPHVPAAAATHLRQSLQLLREELILPPSVLIPSRAVGTSTDPPAFLLSAHCFNPLNYFIKSPCFTHSAVSPGDGREKQVEALQRHRWKKKRKVNNRFKDEESSFQTERAEVSQDTGNRMGSRAENSTDNSGAATQKIA